MMPDAVLPRRAGIVKGDTFLGPPLSSLSVWPGTSTTVLEVGQCEMRQVVGRVYRSDKG